MKFKSIIIVLLIAFLLASCASAAKVVPTETTVPISTLTLTPFTDISTPAPEKIADAQNLSVWIDDYVSAFGGKVAVNGVEMDTGQLTDEIRKNSKKFTQAKQVEGTEYSFLVVNDVPLAVLSDGKWNKTTIKFLDGIVNMRFGSTVHEGTLFVYYTAPYKQVLDEQFEIISPIDPTIMDVSEVMKDPYYGKFVRSFEQTHAIRFYNLFNSWDHRADDGKPNLDNPLWDGAPNAGAQPALEYQEKIKAAMEQKALDILTGNPFVTEIGFANEAISATDDGYFAWEDSPYYRAFGENWLIEAYLATYNAVVKLGKVPGKDIQIFYGEYNFELPGNKSNIVHRELARLKGEVAKTLGINPQDVPIVVEIQGHIVFTDHQDDPLYWGQHYAGDFSYEELKSNFESFSDIGKIWLGEVTFLEGTHEQYTETLSMILKAAINSGNVESILFWDLLELDSDAWGKGDLLFEFNGVDEFVPTITYYEVLKTLFNAK